MYRIVGTNLICLRKLIRTSRFFKLHQRGVHYDNNIYFIITKAYRDGLQYIALLYDTFVGDWSPTYKLTRVTHWST